MVRSFPSGASGKETSCQSRRHKKCRFDPWAGKIPWRRVWQPTPVFLSEESMDRRDWWTAFYRVVHSETRLK